MQVKARKVEYVEVDIDRNDVLNTILTQLTHAIRPRETRKFDDWYVDDANNLIGIKEYHHGSDSHENLGKVDPEVGRMYRAIGTVRSMAITYPGG